MQQLEHSSVDATNRYHELALEHQPPMKSVSHLEVLSQFSASES